MLRTEVGVGVPYDAGDMQRREITNQHADNGGLAGDIWKIIPGITKFV